MAERDILQSRECFFDCFHSLLINEKKKLQNLYPVIQSFRCFFYFLIDENKGLQTSYVMLSSHPGVLNINVPRIH